jgi:predicted restriction endonuclease
MCTALVLALPDFTKSFILETNACDKGIRAVLMQNQRPLSYLSKALGMKNQQLSTYEKELLKLLTVVQKWRHYLKGRPFIIKTYHISMKYLLEQKLTYALQHKSLCKMLGLDYVVQYKKGSENRAADALSRKQYNGEKEVAMVVTEILPSWIKELKESYLEDERANQVLQ